MQMGKKCDLSHFHRGMIVGARQGGLSISETADLLGFSCTAVSRVSREWCKKHSEEEFCRQKGLINERSEKGQTDRSWQEGDSNANNHTLQEW